MPFKLHFDASGSEVPHLDTAVVGHSSKKVRVPGTKGGRMDSILIFEQELIFLTGKIVKDECLLVIEQEQIAIEKLRRSVLVVRVAEVDALVLAEFLEIAPLECGRLARRGAAGLDQIVGSLKIAFLPCLE